MSRAEPDKLAYRVDEAVKASGLSKATLYRLAAAGDLPMVKVLGRTLILAADLTALLDRARAA